MKYVKPLASSAANTIKVIECSTQKNFHLLWDIIQNQKPVALATIAAYEADE